eukprot:c40542_g1_i1 orf=3-320(-)
MWAGSLPSGLHHASIKRLGFGPCMTDVICWLYYASSTRCILGKRLSSPWTLGPSIQQRCPLIELLYALATHPFLVYVDVGPWLSKHIFMAYKDQQGIHWLRRPMLM